MSYFLLNCSQWVRCQDDSIVSLSKIALKSCFTFCLDDDIHGQHLSQKYIPIALFFNFQCEAKTIICFHSELVARKMDFMKNQGGETRVSHVKMRTMAVL